MVKIKPINGYHPKDYLSFTTPPYDVIEKEQEAELKQISDSLVHVILPNGEGDQKYENAEIMLKKFIAEGVITPQDGEAIYIYRQEALDGSFAQEGYLVAMSLEDYEKGNIKKHELTREAPLQDRIKHLSATKMNTELVWMVYKANDTLEALINHIKQDEPNVTFDKYGYKQVLWRCVDSNIIDQVIDAFKNLNLYIADGHHRCAAAANFRKVMMEKSGGTSNGEEPWNYVITYVISDDKVRILPYNRVIRKLTIDKKHFLGKIMESFALEIVKGHFTPKTKGNIGMFFEGRWYNLMPKKSDYGSPEKNLDVSILQDLIIDPILGIKDIRKSDNIFFVGDMISAEQMEEYVKKKGNSIFFSLFPVKIQDIEIIADRGNVMPPKSTWFDPKLVSGLVVRPLF
jgi:uncharacterized protein (DUF1015 family)